MKKLLAKIVSALRALFTGRKQVFYTVWIKARGAVSDMANNTELQELALDAVKNAALRKLKGDDAWREAFGMFKAAVVAKGYEIGQAMMDTILQSVYMGYKAEKERLAAAGKGE